MPGLEEPHHGVVVAVGRRVHDAVGARASSASTSSVAQMPTGVRPQSSPASRPTFPAIEREHADERQVRVIEDRGQRLAADVARRPLHDSKPFHPGILHLS